MTHSVAPARRSRSRRRLVVGVLLTAALASWLLLAVRRGHAPARFWIRADATPIDIRPFESPGGPEITGWRLGDFGCGSHGPWPSHLDVVPPSSAFRSLGASLGLLEDTWPYDEEWESAEPVTSTEGWIEYVVDRRR